MSLSAIAQYLFFSGFLIMFFNETPVVLRHVYKPAINFRHKMELKYGKKWHTWHSYVDYIWNTLIFSGLILSIGNNFKFFLGLFLIYWIPIFIFIYFPLFLKIRSKKSN